ncbi:hypothetical protein BC938DRAFT_484202 [Jimgerdemannia flammicorona]|uniref:Uncharacterized protein n=1 Tax=Jimgerdemannia flammicorona TaxID=994334 RepID=A0A433QAB0_9FUNG|nr:hypothetical protein BC938DRAFT_484202 [Jimgerdemannia flammicorona]
MATLERTRSEKEGKRRSTSYYHSTDRRASPIPSPVHEDDNEITIDTLARESFTADELDMTFPEPSVRAQIATPKPLHLTSHVKDSYNDPDLITSEGGIVEETTNDKSSKISDALSTEVGWVGERASWCGRFDPVFEVIQSLESLKEGSLRALDSLLRQIVADHDPSQLTPPPSPAPITSASEQPARRERSHSRTFSDPLISDTPSSPTTANSREDLLDSIARHARRIVPSGPAPAMAELRHSESTPSPAVSTITEVQEKLLVEASNSTDANENFKLACSLAALLNYIYRMLELTQQPYRPVLSEPTTPVMGTPPRLSSDDTDIQPVTSASEDTLYATLKQEVSMFKRRRSSIPFLTQNPFDERVAVWEEIDHLMDAVTKLLQERPKRTVDPTVSISSSSSTKTNSPPPRYSNLYYGQQGHRATSPTSPTDTTKPPEYTTSHLLRNTSTRINVNSEKMQRDLDNVLEAIERLTRVAPRMNDQRVELTDRQARDMAAAAVYNAVQRLSKGRLEDQRATTPQALTKYETLNRLVEQITKSAARGMNNQRVELTPAKKKNMEVTRIMDRVEKGRMTNQDWHSPEELLVQDMSKLTNQLARSEEPRYTEQRFVISPFKERHMFMNNVFRRVDRLSERRMNNQDANPPAPRPRQKARDQHHRGQSHSAAMKPSDFSELDRMLESLDKVNGNMSDQRATIKSKTGRKWRKSESDIFS